MPYRIPSTPFELMFDHGSTKSFRGSQKSSFVQLTGQKINEKVNVIVVKCDWLIKLHSFRETTVGRKTLRVAMGLL